MTGPERGWAAAEHTREMGRPGLRPKRGKERGNGEQKTEQDRGERQAEQAFGPGMRGRVFLFFQILFYFLFPISFSKPNSSMNQSQIQMGFQTHFSLQSELRNFGKFSKNKFYTFLNSFLFFYLKAIFNFICKSIFKPLNQIHQMQGIYA